jgi:hypothetical protein
MKSEITRAFFSTIAVRHVNTRRPRRRLFEHSATFMMTRNGSFPGRQRERYATSNPTRSRSAVASRERAANALISSSLRSKHS